MPEPFRVLHLITTLDRGGAEKALLTLTAELQAAGRWEQHVMWLKGRGELAGDFAAAGVPARKFSRREFARIAPTILHTHLFKADVLGAALAGPKSRRSVALVSTKHNEDRYLSGKSLRARTWRAVARRTAKRADIVVAISRGVAAFFRETLGDAVGEMPVTPYGVPAPRAVSKAEAAAFRAKFGVADGDALVLCVARLDAQKDHATLFRAMTHLPPSRRARLVLLGRGPAERRLRRLARSMPAARVTFAGFEDDPGPAYAAADVVALSSRWEGLGLVLVEAMQHGRAVVATNVGGVPEVVRHGVTGLLVPPGNPNAFAAALTSVLASATLRDRMGEAGRRIAAGRFGVAQYAHAHDELYERVTAARR